VGFDSIDNNESEQQPGAKNQPPSIGPVDIPVVGMGGSAGALQPFENFLASMPSNSGAAFVVIQHLSPNHESLLPELLARHTPMPVVQAENGLQVEANHVYIIPPLHHLGLRNGVLYFAEPLSEADSLMPIDFFFRSLAEDRKEKAVCILFSGAGSDGILGARSVRASGGLVIAQDPDTAQFSDIPAGAKVAGVVDRILPPEQMPAAILQYLRHPYADSRKRAAVLDPQAKPGDVQEILALVGTQTGCDFTSYKKATVLRRIQRRMGLRQISSLAEYNMLLHQDAFEVKQLLKDLLIKVTAFFRDTGTWDELREKAIVPLIQKKRRMSPFGSGCPAARPERRHTPWPSWLQNSWRRPGRNAVYSCLRRMSMKRRWNMPEGVCTRRASLPTSAPSAWKSFSFEGNKTIRSMILSEKRSFLRPIICSQIRPFPKWTSSAAAIS
jgi:two-component system CheB/CheR fusion protein